MDNNYATSNAPMNEPPPREPRGGKRLPFSGWWPVGFGAFAGLLLRLVYMGLPGEPYSAMLGSFIMGSPILVGTVTVYLAELEERRTWGYYFVAPVVATVLYIVGTLALMIEGWICAIVIIPLFALLGGLSGLAMGAVCRMTKWPRQNVVTCVALLPLLGGAFEHRVPNADRVRTQTRELIVAAPPDAVWRELVDTRDIRPGELESAWLYRIGVPLPSEGAGEFRDGEHLRHITMGRGVHFDQVAVDWEENHRVSWRYRFSADSFPPGALDDHVRIGGQYFDVVGSSFELTAEGAGTRVTTNMSYRVSTHFNWYAGPVADLLVGDFLENLLGFYGQRAATSQEDTSS